MGHSDHWGSSFMGPTQNQGNSGLPCGPVVKNPPAKEATQVWSLVQKFSQMMGQLRPRAATTEDKRYGARVP